VKKRKKKRAAGGKVSRLGLEEEVGHSMSRLALVKTS
jgi:hypothetical protein